MEETENPPNLLVPLRWEPVVLCNGSRFDWHRKRVRAARDRERLEGAHVYRWVFRGADGHLEQCYIGESGNFEQRLPDYRSEIPAKGSTEAMVQHEIDLCEERGGSVDLEFLDFKTPLRLNGRLINNYSLGHREVRLMIENIAIITAKEEGVKLLNRLGDNTYDVKIGNLMRRIIGRKGYPEAYRLLKSFLSSDTRKQV
jgi:hypothetical protein